MFIAVDLKVVEGLAAAVGRAGGMTEDAVLAGLVRLWHRCWADEIDLLTGDEIAGMFAFDSSNPNGSARALAALVAFGFLESKADTTWRVKGAERYLRLKESRRRGAELTNARNAQKRRSKSAALERTGADAQARSLTESPSHRVTESPNKTTTAADGFWMWAQELRVKAGCVREAPPEPRSLSGWYSVALSELNGDDNRLREAWLCFGDDKHWQAAKPPCPFRAFMNAETGWRRYVPRRAG